MTATQPDRTEGGVRGAIVGATRDLLADAALNELSVAQILERAQISRATFYFYFAGRDDAFAAVLDEVLGAVATAFEVIVGDESLRRSDRWAAEVAAWLELGDEAERVMRSAIEEWPRAGALRDTYLTGHGRMATALAAAIEDDRAAGAAPAGVAAPQLASGWLWTVERSWYEAVDDRGRLRDRAAVHRALADTLVAAVHGRPGASPAGG